MTPQSQYITLLESSLDNITRSGTTRPDKRIEARALPCPDLPARLATIYDLALKRYAEHRRAGELEGGQQK